MHPGKLFSYLFYNEGVGDCCKGAGSYPCSRITEYSQREAHDMHGDKGNQEPCEELHYSTHHRKKAVPATLHGITEDKYKAKGDIKHGHNVYICT